MTFSAVTARGSLTHEVSSTTIAMNPTATLTVGKILVVNCTTDNLAAVRGVSANHVSVTDSSANNWIKIIELTESDGVAGDGVTVSTWACRVGTQITTSNTITLTVSANILCKIIMCFEVTSSVGRVYNQEIGAGFSTLTSYIYGMPSREYLLIYHAGAEGTDNAKTPPAGYSELFDLRTGTGTSIASEVAVRIATVSREVANASGWTNTNPMSTLIAFVEAGTALQLTYPSDCITSEARWRYLISYVERLRLIHNIMGLWFREGISQAEYDTGVADSRIGESRGEIVVLPNRVKSIFPYTAQLNQAQWDQFIQWFMTTRSYLQQDLNMLLGQGSGDRTWGVPWDDLP